MPPIFTSMAAFDVGDDHQRHDERHTGVEDMQRLQQAGAEILAGSDEGDLQDIEGGEHDAPSDAKGALRA